MLIPKVDKPKLIQENPQGKQLYQDPNGQAASKEKANSIFAEKVAAKTRKQTEGINAHEDLHASVAGSYGGGKSIDFGIDQMGNPIAVAGRVPIKMPPKVSFKSSLAQINEAEIHAQTVAAAAVAPQSLGGDAGRLSSADKSVHAQATSALGTATSAKSDRIALEARIAANGEKTPDKNQKLTPETIAKAEKPQEKERKPIDFIA